MKKNFIAKILVALLLVTTVFTFNSNLSNEAEAAKVVKPGGVIASATLSKTTVKNVAKQLKVVDGKVRNYGSIMSAVFGQYAIPVGLAFNLSIDAQKRNLKVFEKAAKENKRVKVSIIAGITPNLNYTKYTIVK
ncbi:hypothetical protein LJA00_08505 [Campylobacter jejuni]